MSSDIRTQKLDKKKHRLIRDTFRLLATGCDDPRI
jgi:hypothetical protein